MKILMQVYNAEICFNNYSQRAFQKEKTILVPYVRYDLSMEETEKCRELRCAAP